MIWDSSNFNTSIDIFNSKIGGMNNLTSFLRIPLMQSLVNLNQVKDLENKTHYYSIDGAKLNQNITVDKLPQMTVERFSGYSFSGKYPILVKSL